LARHSFKSDHSDHAPTIISTAKKIALMISRRPAFGSFLGRFVLIINLLKKLSVSGE
jgi:hypothetical protein